jgi:hypothetical protein
MKLYHKNPRQITEKQYRDLSKWLQELGDLSGVVHDLNSDEIISGNQRCRVFDVNECEIEIIEERDGPDEQGTVAIGFVIWEGKKYNYRQVRWSKRQCEQANIVANQAGGAFDFDVLANQFEFSDLISWGFEQWELLGVSGVSDGDLKSKRNNNNFRILDYPKENVGLNFGGIMVVIPKDLYMRFARAIEQDSWVSKQEAVIAILEAGLKEYA